MFAEPLILRWTDAASAWLLTYLVHSTLLLVGVWIVTSRRSMRDATRDVLWKFALVGGLVSASAQTALGREPLGGQLRLDALRRSNPEQVRVDMRDAVGAPARLFVTRPAGTRWTAIVVAFWVTGAGVALLWLTWAHARAARVLSDRTSLDSTPIERRFRALLERSKVRRRVELTSSANVPSPVALASGDVCLPRRALVELDALEQESMLAHELAHVVRRDPQWLIVARALEAVFFMQPLNRLARRRMQAVAEFLCDDWAIQRTSEPVTLARCLAAVAEWVGRTPRLHAMSAMVESAGSPLVQRVRRILGDGRARRPQSSRGALGASFCALVVLAAVAPRISVAGEVLTDRTMTFVRAIVASDSASLPRDRLVIVRSGAVRVQLDSVVARARREGVAAGSIVERSNIVIRRSPAAGARTDSIAIDSVWTRPLPLRGAAAGSPTRARVFVIERRS